MTSLQEPPGGDEKLILCLAQGASVVDAARQSGLSESTVRRRVADPDFGRRVSEVRRQFIDQAIGVLSEAATAAASKLVELLEASNEHTAMSAAKLILELGGKMRDSAEIEQRLAELEARLEDQSKPA